MIPHAITEILDKPGIYEISQRGSPLFFRIEVDENRIVHQLTPALERDGILSLVRWSTPFPIVTPYVRKP